MRLASSIVLASSVLGFAACAGTSPRASSAEPSLTLPSGIYAVTDDRVVADTCGGPAQLRAPHAVVRSSPDATRLSLAYPIDVHMPEDASRVELRLGDRVSSRDAPLPSCPDAARARELFVEEIISNGVRVRFVERWALPADCPERAAAAISCVTDRRVELRLAERCEAPCSLQDAPSGPFCACPAR